MNIFWSPPENPNGKITGYEILYTDDHLLNDRKWKKHKVLGHKTTAALTKLTPSLKYFLKIKAIIEGNELGPPSDVMEFITKSPSDLSKPEILQVVAGKDSSIAEITWRAPQQPMGTIKRYEIYYTSDEIKQNAKWNVNIIEMVEGFDDINDVKTIRKSINSLRSDTNYKFMIKVKTVEDNVGSSSNVFKFLTGPPLTKKKNVHHVLNNDYWHNVTSYLHNFFVLVAVVFIPSAVISPFAILYFCNDNTRDRTFTKQNGTQWNNERRNREILEMIERHKQAKSFMTKRMFEEAVHEYEEIFSMDPSEENERLLEDAQQKLYEQELKISKDYYKILGVIRTADTEDITKAYRGLALKHHPDRHSNASQSEKKKHEKIMKDVNQAYNVLKDPIKRFGYDIFGKPL